MIHCYEQNHKTHPSCGRTGPVGWVQDVGQGVVVLAATGVVANYRELVVVAKSLNGLVVVAIGTVDAGTMEWAGSSEEAPVDSLDVVASAFQDV